MRLSKYYDRDSNEISHDRFMELQAKESYRVVKQEEVNDFYISTIWLGLDHGFGQSEPMIFETLVFTNDGIQGEMFRYSTLDQAVKGHKALISKYKKVADEAKPPRKTRPPKKRRG